MPDEPEASGRDQAGRYTKGHSGNLNGRPRGAKDHITRVLDQLDEMAAEAALRVLRGVLDKAEAGDLQAAAIAFARVWPPRRGRPVAFALPQITSTRDVTAALSAITAAVADGLLTTTEAAELATLIEATRRSIELTAFEERLRSLEERMR